MKTTGKALCVVCDMVVSKASHFTSMFRHKRYYFCCSDCKSTFDKNPFNFTLG